ncbi:transglycosylase SLT domain-containing protein [Albirhodobacter sp. R86504]|uniref:transglycosylase SLT domain-containing protein n=1 Tax=Albirhodobacter sp. R86504 TaxID=3093848 RepID=UPI00366C1966
MGIRPNGIAFARRKQIAHGVVAPLVCALMSFTIAGHGAVAQPLAVTLEAAEPAITPAPPTPEITALAWADRAQVAHLGLQIDRYKTPAAPARSDRPVERPWEGPRIPKLRWDGRQNAGAWSYAAISAIERNSGTLTGQIPSDIDTFCPAYAGASDYERAAFWAALVSGIARFESHFKPRAAGGGGRWIGLMQISPATAQHYNCKLPEDQTADGLKIGAANVSCAIKILARQVGRDGQIAGKAGAWRGAARDWAVMRKPELRENIAAWTRKQPYCQGK